MLISIFKRFEPRVQALKSLLIKAQREVKGRKDQK